MTEQDLLRLKGEIEKAIPAVAELKGQEKALIDQLKEWDCTTAEEADIKIEEMKKEKSIFDNKIATGIEELEKKYQ